MKLLALDTATEACSAALYIDGEMRHRYAVAPRRHSSLILPMAQELIEEAGILRSQLDVVAFGRGPGAFMGVRIATGVAQGIAFAHDLPVVPVSDLAALARRAAAESGVARIACAIDARMDEVYWASYQVNDGRTELIGEEQVCSPSMVDLPGEDVWVGSGTGWGSYGEQLHATLGSAITYTYPDALPDAIEIAELAVLEAGAGRTISASEAVPVYLRNKVARTIAERETEQR